MIPDKPIAIRLSDKPIAIRPSTKARIRGFAVQLRKSGELEIFDYTFGGSFLNVVSISKEEALKLAALINQTWPLDALRQV